MLCVVSCMRYAVCSMLYAVCGVVCVVWYCVLIYRCDSPPSSSPPTPRYDELYDHTGDDGTGADVMDKYENENVGGVAANKATKDELLAMLKVQFDTPPQK